MDFVAETQFQEPILSHVWDDKQKIIYIGLASGQLYSTQLVTNQQGVNELQQPTLLGQHEGPICKIIFWEDSQVFITGGYDGQIIFWQNGMQIKIFQLQHELQNLFMFFPTNDTMNPYFYCISDCGFSINNFGDLQNNKQEKLVYSKLIFQIEQSEKYFFQDIQEYGKQQVTQVSSSDLLQNKQTGEVCASLGSSDNRVLKFKISYRMGKIEYEEPIIFKGSTNQSCNEIFQINSIKFVTINNIHNIYIGSGYGSVISYIYKEKKKSSNYHFSKRCVSQIQPSPNNEFMAYAIGYDWNKGWSELNDINYVPQLYIHKIIDDDFYECK